MSEDTNDFTESITKMKYASQKNKQDCRGRERINSPGTEPNNKLSL